MKTSARGIELIKQFEGLELEAYQDIAGIWTIGYGHTGDVEPGMRISEREAEALLRKDLKPRENSVGSLTNVNLNQNEFDALVSFVYNVGIEAYRRSTARRLLNRNNRMRAADALTWWNKATVGGVLREVAGLTRRRAAERALFLTPSNPPIVREPENIDDNSRITPVEDSPRRDNIAQSRTVQGATVAGGAGIAASSMGRDSAEELDQIETNIESGRGATEDPSAREGSTPPRSLVDDKPEDTCGRDTLFDGEIDFANDPRVQNGDADCEIEGEPSPSEEESETPSAPPEDIDAPSSEESESPGETGDEAPDPQGADAAAEDEPSSDVVAETDEGVVVPEEPDIESGEIVLSDTMPQRPSKHEVHAVEAQVQFALLVLIVLSVLFVIIARIDDWRNYRR